MRLHTLTAACVLAAAAASAFALVAPSPVRAYDDVDRAMDEFEGGMRNFGFVVDDPSKVQDAPGYLAKAEAALEKLRALKPDHEKIKPYEERLAEARAKLGVALIGPLRRQLQDFQGSVERLEGSVEDYRQRRDSESVATVVQKMRETLDRARQLVDQNQAALGGAPGKEFVAEVEKWKADVRGKMVRYGLLSEAMGLLFEEDRKLGLSFDQALTVAADALDGAYPDRAIVAWDAAKKLVKPLQDGKYADVPDVKEGLARYAELEARVAKELKPAMAKARTDPLIASGRAELARLQGALDEQNPKRAGDLYRPLQKVVEELRAEWADVEAVKAFLAEADPVMERTRKELGVKPESQPQADEDVPTFAIDYTADAKVQELLGQLNGQLKSYRERQVEAEKRLGDLDLEKGTDGPRCDQVYRDCESYASSMIQHARGAEGIARELAKVDPAHAAVATMEKAVPRLIKKAQDLKVHAGKKCDYAFQLERLGSRFEAADFAGRRRFEASSYTRQNLVEGYAKALVLCREARADHAKAVELLPEDHAGADAWLAKAKELEAGTAKKLIELCLGDVKTIAAEQSPERAEVLARVYIDALREALPDDPANAELGKILGGAARARGEAETEIKTRREILETRAREAAKAQRPKYDAWKGERKPESPGADQVLSALDSWKGKWVTFRHGRLGSGCYDWFDDSKGEVWHITYPQDMRDAMLGHMKKMDGWVKGMAEQVLTKQGLPAEGATQYVGAHHFTETEIVCEVVGQSMYTPKREVRDQTGNVIGTVEGTPYSVPKVALRAVASTRYVIVPGAGSSLDQVKLDGFLPGK